MKQVEVPSITVRQESLETSRVEVGHVVGAAATIPRSMNILAEFLRFSGTRVSKRSLVTIQNP